MLETIIVGMVILGAVCFCLLRLRRIHRGEGGCGCGCGCGKKCGRSDRNV